MAVSRGRRVYGYFPDGLEQRHDFRRLFDDSVAPEIFGFKVDRSNVLKDSVFQERVGKADQIQAVRLSTIQQDKAGLVVRYRLILSPLPPALAGEPLSPETDTGVAGPAS